MNDTERAAKATQRGGWMYAPVERQRCSKHPTRWITYQWRWHVDSTIEEVADIDVISGCDSCAQED